MIAKHVLIFHGPSLGLKGVLPRATCREGNPTMAELQGSDEPWVGYDWIAE